MEYILMVIAVMLFGLSVAIDRCIHQLPFNELKRRARSGHSVGFYHLAVRANKTQWFVIALNVLVNSYAITTTTSWWQVAAILGALAWLAVGWRSLQRIGLVESAANFGAELLAKLFDRLPGMHAQAVHPHQHTQLFDKDDLLDLLERQTKQTDSRINEAELATAIRSLKFSGLKVQDVMTELSKAKLVQEGDDIGPHLLSEMHGEGESFLVVKAGPKSSQPKPLGVLYLDDALAHAEGGVVKDAMRHGVQYIDEDLALIAALDEFLNRKQHFFAVTNSFEELVGTLSMRQVLEQIFGPKHLPKSKEAEPEITDDAKIAPNESENSK